MEGVVLGLRPTGCVHKLPIKKKSMFSHKELQFLLIGTFIYPNGGLWWHI